MTQFIKQPVHTLDVSTGKWSGAKEKKPEPTIGTMPIPEFHRQVMAMAQKGTPLKKVHGAIDKHPDIEDKPRAKSMSEAVYRILGKK